MPQLKFVLSTNHEPIITGDDHAIWRRIRLIPFTVIIPPDEQDKDLIEKLLEERPGILNWALEGTKAYQREGLDPPKCVLEATEEYRSEMDIFGDWIEECCFKDPDAKVAVNALYASYQAWCQDNGRRPFSKRRFSQKLEGRGFERGRTGQSRLFLGLALNKINLEDVANQTVYGAFGTG